MPELKELENEFYIARFGMPKKEDAEALWQKIKQNPRILKEAIKVKRNKWNSGDLLTGNTIADAILRDYENIDQEIYQELVNTIYSNKDIARIVRDESISFLLLTLQNPTLKLSEEQKNFALEEAMKKSGTTQDEERKQRKTELNLDTCKAQVHGHGAFDIRYFILRNPNWTAEEKQELIYQFWVNDKVYMEYLEEWEWAVVNDDANFVGNPTAPFDRYELMNEWTYEQLLNLHHNKDNTDRIWSDINFCKQMHAFRPASWEVSYKKELKNFNEK